MVNQKSANYGQTAHQPRRKISPYVCGLHIGKSKWKEWETEGMSMENNDLCLSLKGNKFLSANKFIPMRRIFTSLLTFVLVLVSE